MSRKGEKIGWTAGWLGAFVWVFLVAFMFLFQGKLINAVSGLSLFGVAVLCVVFCSPWRHPATRYGKLMILPYVLFFAAVAWVVWSYGGVNDYGLGWWNFLWLVVVLIPFGLLAAKKWSDNEEK